MFAAAGTISDAGPGMAKEYRRRLTTRAINWSFQQLTRLGLGASYRHILTVPGRKTGQLRSTPVDVIDVNGHRWLVAGYGPARVRKDVREFIRRLEAAGLTVESTPGHYRVLRDGQPLRKANGMPFMLPFSPDTIRWRRAAVVELRKLGVNL